MKYTVTIAEYFVAYHEVEVEADSLEQAEIKGRDLSAECMPEPGGAEWYDDEVVDIQEVKDEVPS